VRRGSCWGQGGSLGKTKGVFGTTVAVVVEQIVW
jgi:hypothetical protein